jgi:ferredoxin-thioredoxin reductase catalytic subunit
MGHKNPSVSQKEIDTLYTRLKKEAEDFGYHLNPDVEFTRDLIRGIIINDKRFGYWACPCRLASGKKKDDLDIICPCDYRDPDLDEYGTCYCGLYVSKDAVEGRKEITTIPERRPPESERRKETIKEKPSIKTGVLEYPVWRCTVCGYLCARNAPPEICPICKAKKDRFTKFINSG